MRQTRTSNSMSSIYEREHFVQFYHRPELLLQNVVSFIGAGLNCDNVGVVIATSDHLQSLASEMAAKKIDLIALQDKGLYVPLDASATLELFMVDGLPSKERFASVIGSVMQPALDSGRSVRAFGEMVAVLWNEGNHTAAVLLEELWNDLARQMSFTLFCAYPSECFSEHGESVMQEISRLHSSAITPSAA
jgi:hypothetical protein